MTHADFIHLFDDRAAADEFEMTQMSVELAMLPGCAQNVVAGGPKGSEYWAWLVDQVARI